MTPKHLLTGAAIAAALAIAAPSWAQNPNAPASGRMPQGGRATSTGTYIPSTPPSSPAAAPAPMANSAMPPSHHAVRHARAMHAFHKHMAAKAALTGDTTAQLNREELARLQTGAPPSPPPASAPMPAPEPGPAPSGGNAMGLPGPNSGGPGLTPYSGGAPH